MGRRDRQRRTEINGGAPPFRNEPVPRAPMLVCGKCHHAFPDYAANEHLIECQPQGAKCATCKEVIPAAGFIEHYRTCKGPKLVDDKPKEAL